MRWREWKLYIRYLRKNMSNIKNFARNSFPGFYRRTQNLYHNLRYFLEKYVLGSKIQEFIWQTRHIYKGKQWLKENWQTKDDPAIKKLRSVMVQKIRSYSPRSVLDFGCGTGPQLYLLSQVLKETKFLGLELNKHAVIFGQNKFKEENISNVELVYKTANYLSKIPDKSFDVIYTMAVMFYIGPDKIEKIAKEMLRIAKKAVILAEPNYPHTENDKNGMGIYVGGHWLRNFPDLFASLGINRQKIKVTKAADLWGSDALRNIAAIIEIEL